jgi:hypothetical protein
MAENGNTKKAFAPSKYLLSTSSDWLARYPRKVNITVGCNKCYDLNFKDKTPVTQNLDGTYSSHFIYCSEPCMVFNKQMNAMYWDRNRKRKADEDVS